MLILGAPSQLSSNHAKQTSYPKLSNEATEALSRQMGNEIEFYQFVVQKFNQKKEEIVKD